LVLASRALSKETMAMDIDGSPARTAVYRSYKAEAMAGKPVKITNTGDAPVQAVVSVSGSPITPEPAASNGFKIERNYFTLDGKPVFTVAYVVRAVSPGKYVLPQAYVEDMYNPSRYGRSGTGTVEVRSAK